MTDYVVLLSERIDPNVKKGVAVAAVHYPEIVKLDSPELVEAYRVSLCGEQKYLDPNRCLYTALKSATDDTNILAAGMAIRYGANVNQLCESDLVKGELHIICYTILENPNIDMRRLLVSMLVFSGARMTDKASKRSDITVFEWIQDNVGRLGIPTRDGPPADPDDVDFYRTLQSDLKGSSLNGDSKLLIGLALDNISLVNMAETSRHHDDVLKQAVEWHASDVFDSVSRDRLSAELMVASINNYNVPTFNACVIGGGFLPNYLITNNMLVKARRLFREKKLIPYVAICNIVDTAVKYGLPLDKDQLLLLSSTDKFTVEKIKKNYQIPFWEKECKSYRTPISSRLQSLAANLHLRENEKETICKRISLMAASDPKVLTEAVVSRRKDMLQHEYSDAIPGGTARPANGFTCSQLIDDKINEYSDLDTVKYRESSGTVWCFTRDKIDMLLQDRTNPVTSEPLPQEFLIRLEAQKKLLEAISIPTDQPLPFSRAVEMLKQKDSINDAESATYRQSFEKYAELNGIDVKEMRGITKDKLEVIISEFIQEPTNFEELTQPHAYTTFCRVARSILAARNVDSDQLLMSISTAIRSS